MTRLTRKNMKIFAGSAVNNGVFGSLQANDPTLTSDVESIQSLSAWGEGWDAATATSELLPPLEEMQGVQYVVTYQQAYMLQEGIPEWNTNTEYGIGSVAKENTSTGFKIYSSLSNNNIGNLLSDTSNWKLVMSSDDTYAYSSEVVVDNVSINRNTNSEMQTIGVINQNAPSTALKEWSGTKAQYDAIATKDSNTLYNITDDTSDIYTQVSAILNRMYPVGSIYLTVSNENPAVSLGIGSWTKVGDGRVIQGADSSHAAGSTISAGLPNITGQLVSNRLGLSSSVGGNGYGTGAFLGGVGNGDGYLDANSYGAGIDMAFPNRCALISINAANANPIYGASNTVQPPAFVVNIWQRIS